LLSVMGSQGDAGQFRTPRHIIDFLVDIVDPNKNDKILDPACGTAGFLISAFKHIKEKNNNQLTPDERKKLIQNFVGYDISPDMVRLSLVNLYLHGFSDPHIFEYDTLTSEERWDEYFDVILANPPFMTPKGGIRPHKKFTIKSNRSEVLFVDYIAEHLNPNGKAGIIVPEGIIFQSASAYRDLRKMLVESSLWAVVSLPSGVFNPYSGVKTSILLLDRNIAKKTDRILFAKIDNDGFDLGAQRRIVKGSQLDEAKETLNQFKNNPQVDIEPSLVSFQVEKSLINEENDFNLTSSRYQDLIDLSNITFPIIEIGQVFDTSSGGTPNKSNDHYYNDGTIPWLRSGEVSQGYIFDSELKITEEGLKNSSAKIFPVNTVLVAMYGATAGQVGILKFEASTNQTICGILPNEKAIPEYIYLMLKSQKELMIKLSGGGAQPNISQKIVKGLKIPLPSLDIQKEIVEEIEGYQKIIDGAKLVVGSYRPQIKINSDWKIKTLSEVADVNPKKSQVIDLDDSTEVSFVPMADLGEHQMSFEPKETKRLEEVYKGYTYFQNDDILLAKVTPCFENGKAGIAKNLVNGIGFGSSEFIVIRASEEVYPDWIYYVVASNRFRIIGQPKMTGTGGLKRVPRDFVEDYPIPVPSKEVQLIQIEKIRKQQETVARNRELIQDFEQKIKDRIAEVWGEK
ncbi:MAG: N-6 DNA methylase, partial [Fulvivirga sp.]|uniref:N-6 DNA methylase n=1 Tax=Fulvivirga sp. TaxID=1931237 RepID=UPI0032EFFAF6